MKKILLSTLVAFLSVFSVSAANQNIANLITSSDWEALFPNRNALYTYASFSQAVDDLSDYEVTYENPGTWGLKVTVRRKTSGLSHSYNITSANWPGDAVTVDFEKFCNTGDNFNDKRELAAFFSNITKETTGGTTGPFSGLANSHSKHGLVFLNEISGGAYNTASGDFPGAGGQSYFGRGPMQLSWNYNYGRFSQFLYGNSTILNNPGELSSNGITSFMSAIWFWMTPQCPKPSCHQVMQGIHDETAVSYAKSKMSKKGFLHTVNIINGAIECRSTANLDKVQLRADLYSYFLDILGFTVPQRTAENTGDYSSLCVEGSASMSDYTLCAFREVTTTCTSPNLGVDQSICGSDITLDAGVTLGSGEAIAWYNGANLINGATSTTYLVSTAGTYKAVITGPSCSRESLVTISTGGSLQTSSTNDYNFCGGGGGGGPESTTISVTGGGGLYNLYDVATDGTPIRSGSDFTFNALDVNANDSKTFYIDEPAGDIYTIGLTQIWDEADIDLTITGWENQTLGASWLLNRMVFTTLATVTLQSIDFDIAKTAGDATLDVKIYTYGSYTTPVASIVIDLETIDYNSWDNVGGYTAALNFELPAGQYALDITGSNIIAKVAQYKNDTKVFAYDSWNAAGVASIDFAKNIGAPSWDPTKIAMFGAYNWKFSTGGSGSSCGRTPLTINNNCATGSEDITKGSLSIFPNPASDIMNISFDGIKVDGAIIELFNQVGQVVISKTLNGNTNIAQIQTDELDAGVYFVKVTSGNDTYNSNVVITK